MSTQGSVLEVFLTHAMAADRAPDAASILSDACREPAAALDMSSAVECGKLRHLVERLPAFLAELEKRSGRRHAHGVDHPGARRVSPRARLQASIGEK